LQRFYDQLLDVRIRLQKALLALNSLPQGDKVDTYKNAETEEFLDSTREQAYSLFLKTLNLNNVLHTSVPSLTPQQLYRDQTPKPTLKRKFKETSLPALLESLESTNSPYTPFSAHFP
jgi:hypothetical protein